MEKLFNYDRERFYEDTAAWKRDYHRLAYEYNDREVYELRLRQLGWYINYLENKIIDMEEK